MKRGMRLFLAAALSGAFGAGVLTAAPAHAADDWVNVSHLNGIPGHIVDKRQVAETYKGGAINVVIGWKKVDEVYVLSAVSDTAGDGYGLAVQIRYKALRSGGWSDWNYRLPAKAGGNGTVDRTMYRNIPAIAQVQARGCYYNSAGTLVNCDNTWH